MSKEYGGGNEPSHKKFNEIIGGNYEPADIDRISRILDLEKDTARFEGDNLLTFLGHSASQILRVASSEGVIERAKYDKHVNPVTVNVGDQKHIVGYVKPVVSEDPTKPPRNTSHLVVMNNGEIFETEALSEEDRDSYSSVMSKRLALSGVELDEEGKISPKSTRKLFTFLELEKGVHVKATQSDPGIYEVVQRTLGIDPVLSKHVAKEYEPISRDNAEDVIEPVVQKPEDFFLLENPTIPLPRNPAKNETIDE